MSKELDSSTILQSPIDNRPQFQLQPGQEEICCLSPESFDGLSTTLDVFKEAEVINIINSVVGQNLSSTSAIYAKSDIHDLLGDMELTLSIPSPASTLVWFKEVRGDKDVLIIKDDNNKQLIITNSYLTSFVPYDESLNNYVPPIDDNDLQQVGNEITVNDLDGESIKKLAGSVDDSKIYLLLDDNKQLQAIQCDNRGIFPFPEFAGTSINFETAAHRLKVSRLLPIKCNSYYKLSISEGDDKFWLLTESDTKAGITVNLIEPLEVESFQQFI